MKIVMDIGELLKDLGLDLQYMIAGFAGGVISLVTKEKVSVSEAIVMIFTGTMVAAYTTPLLKEYWRLNDAANNALAFWSGLLSMYIISGMIKLALKWKSDPKLPMK